MRYWADNELFKEVLAFMLMDESDWDAMVTVQDRPMLLGMANMSETAAIELSILSTYLRERGVKVTHERAMQVARRDMRRKLGARE